MWLVTRHLVLTDWYKSCGPATFVSLPFRRHKQCMALKHLSTCSYWRGTNLACDNRGGAMHYFYPVVDESRLAGMVLYSCVSCCFLSPSFSLHLACILLFLPSCRFCYGVCVGLGRLATAGLIEFWVWLCRRHQWEAMGRQQCEARLWEGVKTELEHCCFLWEDMKSSEQPVHKLQNKSIWQLNRMDVQNMGRYQ